MKKVITALQAQKNNPQRVNIFINDEFAFGLARIVAAWLQVGQELSEAQIAMLLAKDQEEKALQRALNLLSYRARSEAEIRSNLRKHKIPEEAIATTINRLRANGLLNDQEFAQTWIENRAAFRPRSKLALRMELKNKDIPEHLIEAALSSVNEAEEAQKAAQKKARQLRTAEEQEFKHKLLGYLSRRGFDYQTSLPIVQQLWNERKLED